MTVGPRIMETLLVRIRVVILDRVESLVITDLGDQLDLTFEFPSFRCWVCGTWYGRGRSSRRCTGLRTWQLDYFFLDLRFVLRRFFVVLPLSASQRFAIAGSLACIHRRCFADLNGIS